MITQLKIIRRRTITVRLQHIRDINQRGATRRIMNRVHLSVRNQHARLTATRANVRHRGSRLTYSHRNSVRRTNPLLRQRLRIIITRTDGYLNKEAHHAGILRRLQQRPRQHTLTLGHVLGLLFSIITLRGNSINRLGTIRTYQRYRSLHSTVSTARLYHAQKLARTGTLNSHRSQVFRALKNVRHRSTCHTIALLIRHTQNLLTHRRTIRNRHSKAQQITRLNLDLDRNIRHLRRINNGNLTLKTTLHRTRGPTKNISRITHSNNRQVTTHTAGHVPRRLTNTLRGQRILRAQRIKVTRSTRISVPTQNLPYLTVRLNHRHRRLLDTRHGRQQNRRQRGTPHHVNQVNRHAGRNTRHLRLNYLNGSQTTHSSTIRPLVTRNLNMSININRTTRRRCRTTLKLTNVNGHTRTLNSHANLNLYTLLRAATNGGRNLTTQNIHRRHILTTITHLGVRGTLRRTTIVTIRSTHRMARRLIVTTRITRRFGRFTNENVNRNDHLKHNEQTRLTLLTTGRLSLNTARTMSQLLHVTRNTRHTLPHTHRVTGRVSLRLVNVLRLVSRSRLGTTLMHDASN